MRPLSELELAAGLRFIDLGAGGSEGAADFMEREPLGRPRMAMALGRRRRRIERLAMLRLTID